MKKQHKSIRKSEKIWSIVFIALCAAMVLTVLITLHIDGRFSSGDEEASRLENSSLDETNAPSENVELLAAEETECNSAEMRYPEYKVDEPLKTYVGNPSIELDPGVETSIYDIEADCFIFD